MSATRAAAALLVAALAWCPSLRAEPPVVAPDPLASVPEDGRGPGRKADGRARCGCPSARLLGLSKASAGPDAGGEAPIAAWLHDGARIEAFVQDPTHPQRLTALPWPAEVLVLEEFDGWEEREAVPTSSRLVRVRVVGPPTDGLYVGILRRVDRTPRDVVRVAGIEGVEGAAPVEASSGPPRLRALWLAPLERPSRPGCAVGPTHRVAFEGVDGSATIAGFLVTDVETGRSALIDLRAATSFGIGRVDACAQGIALEEGRPARLELRPVAADFAVGDAWAFATDGVGRAVPARVAVPPEADPARVDAPFPVPGADDPRRPSLKRVALGVMAVGVGGAALVALFVWVILPRRKRRLVEVRCPTCRSVVPVDALDPSTDGFFCPSCGASGFWKGTADAIEARPLDPPGPSSPASPSSR